MSDNKLFPTNNINNKLSSSCINDDDNIYNPYNHCNIEITEDDIYDIFKKYGISDIKINNINLYRRAFVHKSYIKKTHEFAKNIEELTFIKCPPKCMKLNSKSNERLEFLGDGVLELITKYYLYRRFPKENEGFMTEKKIAIVKNESIGKLAMHMNLNKWIIISRIAEESNTRQNIKKMGCLFEAFLGALFLDCNKIKINDSEKWFEKLFVTGPGLQVAQIFIENIFEQHIDWSNIINIDDNYKKILQVKIQKDFKVTPYYIEIENYDENTGYVMGVYLCIGQHIYDINKIMVNMEDIKTFEDIHNYLNNNNGKIYLFMGKSTNKIKRKAEQNACCNILKILDDNNK
jgi:dsRNA-specific ribonuclease